MYVCGYAQGGNTFPLGTTSLLEGSSGLQEDYTKACPNSAKKNYLIMLVLCHDTIPKFHDFQVCFGFTGIEKLSFSIIPAEPRCPDV